MSPPLPTQFNVSNVKGVPGSQGPPGPVGPAGAPIAPNKILTGPSLVAGDWVCTDISDSSGLTIAKALTGKVAVAGGILGPVIAAFTTGATNVNVLPNGFVLPASMVSDLGAGSASDVFLDITTGRAVRAASIADHRFKVGTVDTIGNVTITGGSRTGPAAIRVFDVTDYGAKADCVNGNPATGTNNTPFFQAAQDAMVNASYAASGSQGIRGAILYVPPSPIGTSYKLDGYTADPLRRIEHHSAFDIECSMRMMGAGGSQNAASCLTLGSGLSIITHGQNSAPMGGVGDGAIISDLQIKANAPASITNWTQNHAYSLSDKIHLVQDYRFWFECVKAGISANTAEPNLCALVTNADRSVKWAPGLQNVRNGTVVRSTNDANYAVFFLCTSPTAASNTALTTGGTEPTWDTTPGHTTTETSAGGPTITWTCYSATGYIIVDGTVYWAARDSNCIRKRTCSHVENVALSGADGPMINEMAATSFVPSCVSSGSTNQRVTATGCKIGILYQGISCNGGATNSFKLTGLGTSVDADPANIGIWDNSDLGNAHYSPQLAGFSGRAIYLANADGFGTVFGPLIGSDCGKSEITGHGGWVGSTGNGAKFSSGTPSIANDGAHGMYEKTFNAGAATVPQGTAGLAAGGVSNPLLFPFHVDDTVDSYGHGLAYDSTKGHWNLRYNNLNGTSAFTITGSQAVEGRSLFGLKRGHFAGASSDGMYYYSGLTNYQDSGIMFAVRNAGDRFNTRTASKIITQGGAVGPPWVANTAYTQGYAAPLPYAVAASVVIPTNPAVSVAAFVAQNSGTSGSSEPDWTTASSLDDTLVDGTITWKNIGGQATYVDACEVTDQATRTIVNQFILHASGSSLPKRYHQRLQTSLSTNTANVVLGTFTPVDGKATRIFATVIARQSAGTGAPKFATWRFEVTYSRASTTLTAVDALVTTTGSANAAGPACSLTTSSAAVNIVGTGESSKTWIYSIVLEAIEQ